MSILLIAEHDNTNIKNPTLSTIKAASEIGGEVDLLVVGENCSDAADHATSIHGINKVLVADSPVYANFLAENISLQLENIQWMNIPSKNIEREEINSDDKFLKIVKNITSKGFVRSNYEEKLVDLSDIRLNLKSKN